MSDGAFRDDQEAALARAEALEAELARAKRENEALREKTEQLEHERDAEHRRADDAEKQVPKRVVPKPAAAKPEGTAQLSTWVSVVGFVVVVIGLIAILRWRGHRDGTRDREVGRWSALIDAPRCLRRALDDDAMSGVDAPTQDPRNKAWVQAATPALSESQCSTAVDMFVAMPAFEAEIPDLQRWQTALAASDAAVSALNDYYTKKDWKDDGYASGPAKWHAAQVASSEQHAAGHVVVDRVLSIIESELRRYEKAYEDRNGRDATWWKIELGCLLQIAADDWIRGDFAKAKAEAAAIETAAAGAPIDVRRATRDGYNLSTAYFKNDLLRGLSGRYTTVIP